MNLRKYIPFVGGVTLFVVALWASNVNLNLGPREVKATESPDCEQAVGGANDGYCLEFATSSVFNEIEHDTPEPAETPKDSLFLQLYWHWPTSVISPSTAPTGGSPAPYVSSAKLTLEQYDSSTQTWEVLDEKEVDTPAGDHFDWGFFGFDKVGEEHNYAGYEFRAYLTLVYSDSSVQNLPYTDSYIVSHPEFECGNQADDDSDGKVDHDGGYQGHGSVAPDPHCVAPEDDSEAAYVECSNGIDDDGDGKIDFKEDGTGDTGCEHWEDFEEDGLYECEDGIDNDGDGYTDAEGEYWQVDPHCRYKTDNSEDYKVRCSNGVDDDGDGDVDWSDDWQCDSPNDMLEGDENTKACANGLDDDGDGKIDWPADPGCPAPYYEHESYLGTPPECFMNYILYGQPLPSGCVWEWASPSP